MPLLCCICFENAQSEKVQARVTICGHICCSGERLSRPFSLVHTVEHRLAETLIHIHAFSGSSRIVDLAMLVCIH